MQLAWRPTPDRLAGRLEAAAATRPTCPDLGLLSGAPVPPGFVVLDEVTVLGTDPVIQDLVAAALLRWDLHRQAGMVLAVSEPVVRTGSTMINAARAGPVAVLAPCRVVATVDEPARRGFVYATLPGHPVIGEELFAVECDGAGRVCLHLRSVSRPRGLAALAPALARGVQGAVNRRYAAAARRVADRRVPEATG